MNITVPDPLSAEETQLLAASVGLILDIERSQYIAGALHHIRTSIARLDELPMDDADLPAPVFNAGGERKI
ncbi:hypothetical protein [Xenorhabdus sp. PB30.3]|uniref:hypothetical protein n=1 Tax=Xenorhabdus sp. PB30.3 TaxID=2788941 RepID=UPI001E51D4D1|nr:hypothetical protein [Xenorhabdus sp. PB30.3]MCC8380874.1 hypothetical protein [Xenorhabdus sp. PB30.3]